MCRYLSSSPSTQPTPTRSGRSDCWRPSASSVLKRRQSFTRPPPPSCTASSRKLPRRKRPLSTHACNGILFNHESPQRGETFVTRKITRGLARIKVGLQQSLFLGNLDAKRDWGHARDYVEMQYLMLQQEKPQDYVIATGQQFSVREFVQRCAAQLELDLTWSGSGIDEKAVDAQGNVVVAVDPRYFRPTEVETLLGDPSKARRELGWVPQTPFSQLIKEMVEADLKSAQRDALAIRHGFDAFNVRET
jgi:GDPmannose 4,6-dehydratase